MCHKGKMATLKRSHNETLMKNKYDALKELEKGVPQKEVALRFGVQKSTLSTWKRNKTKIEEVYHAGKVYLVFAFWRGFDVVSDGC